MSDSPFFRAAKMVGLKGTLEDGCFVGRRREIQALGSALLGSQVTSLWIYGPRRIGKSSLSNRIPKHQDVRIVRISCDQITWSCLDDVLNLFAKEASEQLDCTFGSAGKPVLKELARLSSGNRRVILVLDEFDGVAVNLQQEEQAFFRGVLQKHPYFGIIFISRLSPEQLLQDYSQENSRLLGVCGFIRLPMLTLDEVSELTERIERVCGESLGGWLPRWMHDRVGGYAVAIQALLHEYLLLADRLGSIPRPDQVQESEHSFFERVMFDLKGLWNDLSYEVRRVLKGEIECSGKFVHELKSLNMFSGNEVLKPLWLLHVAEEAETGTTTQNLGFFGLAQSIVEHIKRCNVTSLRRGGTTVFQVTQAMLSIFSIARAVRTEEALNNGVNTLYKICVENTNSDKLKGGDRCLIPIEARPAYKDSEGFNVLVAYRNFIFHDPSQDLAVAEQSKRYKNIGSICSKYLGGNKLTPITEADYNRIYEGILTDINKSVTALDKALNEADTLSVSK